MTEEQIKLIEDNYKIVYYVVNRYFKMLNREIKEDLISEGFLSLTRKANQYDPTRGSFSTFIVKCIYLDLIAYLKRYESKHSNTASIDDMITDTLNFSDVLSTEQEEFKYIDLYTSLNKLPERKKDIITKIFLEGRTQFEVASEYKISPQRISIIVNDTLNELKNNLNFNKEIKNKKSMAKEVSKDLGISERTYYRKKAKLDELSNTRVNI